MCISEVTCYIESIIVEYFENIFMHSNIDVSSRWYAE